MTDTTTLAVRYERDADGVATLWLDDPNASANTVNEAYFDGMDDVLARLRADLDAGAVIGVIVASAKKTFFAGGDLKQIQGFGPADAQAVFDLVDRMKAQLRLLETCGVPVVAAINGAALGGGLEIALATHHRIAVDAPNVVVGLPEVNLGILPGGGGTTRIVRMKGLLAGFLEVLSTGTAFKPAAAVEKGLVDELVASRDELLPAAKAWILAHRDDEDARTQPWDRKGYKIPGGSPSSPALAAFLPAVPGTIRKQVKGVPFPAPHAIAAAAVEGAQVDFDSACIIESRYFTALATGRVSKAMIQAFFFDIESINKGLLRPAGHDRWQATKVAVLGAGMMGAGIAYAAARAGIDVVLKDVSVESAQRGKAYSEGLLTKQVERGRLSREAADEILERITPTDDYADLAGCDLVIEAVFEDPALKAQVYGETEPVVAPDALLGSNTSTLPITELAQGVQRRADFIGIHFFSPVDKMPLVEIIRGQETSDAALAKALDFVAQIKKTPIVVNDSRGFYTSRVIGFMVNEGMAMLAEGVQPWSIERATTQAGYPSPVLQLSDELNLKLMAKITQAARDAAEPTYQDHPGGAVVERMLELGRPGRLERAGFYEYDETGARQGLWPGLAEVFPVADVQIPLDDIKDRMMFAEALETAKCFEEGVIESAAAANIGSIMGIGFPAISGGAVTFMTNYEGGLPGFIARANELADAYGERFRPTKWLVALAEQGGEFPA